MQWLAAAGTAAAILATIISWAAWRASRADRGTDKLESLAARVGRLETQMEPFWAAVQQDLIRILHHPWPERAGMDALLDKLDPRKPGTLTPAERAELKELLRKIIDGDPADPPPFGVSTDERVVAVFLLHAMDLTGGKLMEGKREPPRDQRMAEVAEALMGRVERALRPVRWLAIGAVITAALMIAGGADLVSMQHRQCQAGNSYRAADEANWDDFLRLALGPRPKPAAVGVAGQIRDAVRRHDAPRGCPWLTLP